MKQLRSVVIVLLAAWAQSAFGQLGISYGPTPAQVLDLYRPAGTGPFPVAIYYHGGGSIGGDRRSSFPPVLRRTLLNSGFAVASVGYTLNKGAGATYADAARAVQFLRYRARGYRLDPNDFVTAGHSTGAGIAQWIGFHADLANPASASILARMSTRVDAVLALSPQPVPPDPADPASYVYHPLMVRSMVTDPVTEIVVRIARDADFNPYYPEAAAFVRQAVDSD